MRYLVIALTVLATGCFRADGFSPEQIIGPLIGAKAPPLAPCDQEALSQSFYYLGKGRQCFVFESADRKIVLKFFNQKYFEIPWYSFLFAKEKEKRALRRRFYEHSYEIAYREFGEEILYLHLGPSEIALPKVALIDKAKRVYEVDLNQIPFVLQRKGIPFYEGLTAIFQREGLPGLCREIDTFMGVIAHRMEKEIADGDHNVKDNWGYIEGKIFHLDPGRLYYDPQLKEPERQAKEWYSSTHQFYKWLKKSYPEAASYFKRKYSLCYCEKK